MVGDMRAKETAEKIVAAHVVGGKITGAVSLRDAIAAAIRAEAEGLVSALEDIRINAAEFTHGDVLVQHLVSGIFSRADKAIRDRHKEK
jgi:hypothetical protein